MVHFYFDGRNTGSSKPEAACFSARLDRCKHDGSVTEDAKSALLHVDKSHVMFCFKHLAYGHKVCSCTTVGISSSLGCFERFLLFLFLECLRSTAT